MIYWDSSALIPLLIEEPHSQLVKEIIRKDLEVVTWWGSLLECLSAVSRRRREGILSHDEEDDLRQRLETAFETWTEIEPGEELRRSAGLLLFRHPLRSADSLQLAAALTWVAKDPHGHQFVCLDGRLRDAARNEGFKVLPEKT